MQQPWNLNNTTILVFVRHVQAADRDSDGNLTNVETTPAASPDDTALGVVHTSLAAADRLPAEHLVDKGYTDSHVLVDSERNYGITIIGPVADDPSWQAQAGVGFAKADFVIDWEARTATCPAGKQSLSWRHRQVKADGMDLQRQRDQLARPGELRLGL